MCLKIVVFSKTCSYGNVSLFEFFYMLQCFKQNITTKSCWIKTISMFYVKLSNKLKMLLLCVQSGWNRILIALVHLRKWKAKWIFHILDSRSSIVVLDALQESSFSKTKSCVSFVFQVRQTQLLVFSSETNLNMQNSVVMLAFSVFDRKYRF